MRLVLESDNKQLYFLKCIGQDTLKVNVWILTSSHLALHMHGI